MQRPHYHIITKVFKAQATAAEKGIVWRWIKSSSANKEEYRKLKAIWEKYGELHQNYQPHFQNGFKRIENSIQKGSNTGKLLYKIAASIAILLICGISIYRHVNASKVFIAQGCTLEFSLPDGSSVALRPGAILSIDERFDKDVRQVTLQGEALFEVTKNEDKPFIVHCPDLSIRVLGTTFLVTPYQEKTEVSLFEGKVSITAGNEKVVLTPNQRAVFDGNLNTYDGLRSNALSWHTQTLSFQNQPLNKVFEELEQHYQVQLVTTNAFTKKRLTATFQDQSIEEVLEAISKVHPLQIKKKSKNHFYLSIK